MDNGFFDLIYLFFVNSVLVFQTIKHVMIEIKNYLLFYF